MKRWIKITREQAACGFTALALGLTAWLTIVRAESPEAREVKEKLARQFERMKSLEVSYNFQTKSDLKPEQLRKLADFQNLLFLTNEEWHEAFKGEKRYRRKRLPERRNWIAPTDQFGSTPPPEVDPKASRFVQEQQKSMKAQYDLAVTTIKANVARGGHVAKRTDPAVVDRSERDVIQATNGRSLWMRRSMAETKDMYLVQSASSKVNWFQVTPYLSAVGMHQPDPTVTNFIVRKVQGMFQVAELVKERAYEVEDQTEVIDGSTCIVLKGSLNSLLQPGLLFGTLTDRIWLDRDHGLAVRRRELARDGQLGQRWENSELREVEPGLWLPTRIKHEQFATDAPPDWRDKAVVTEEIKVESIEVNRVPDERFDMVAKPGDRVEDLRGAF
jgi:hypothetical protein